MSTYFVNSELRNRFSVFANHCTEEGHRAEVKSEVVFRGEGGERRQGLRKKGGAFGTRESEAERGEVLVDATKGGDDGVRWADQCDVVNHSDDREVIQTFHSIFENRLRTQAEP